MSQQRPYDIYNFYDWSTLGVSPKKEPPKKLSGFIAKNGDTLEISKHIDEKEPRYSRNDKEIDKETYDTMQVQMLSHVTLQDQPAIPKQFAMDRNPCKFAEDIATAPITSVTPRENFHYHGDLKVDGDLIVEGRLDVSGTIKAGEEEPEVLLTPEELSVIIYALDLVTYDKISQSLGLEQGEAARTLSSIYHKLGDED